MRGRSSRRYLGDGADQAMLLANTHSTVTGSPFADDLERGKGPDTLRGAAETLSESLTFATELPAR